ncbi:MAG TPA: carboxypeptidase regulatory-like domain-containing protein, partial [Vicinamibacterales bacterium]|nr:carboxypeptidase regulatory-like domain-containing protein [Vicinamibacterales bacterium]
MTSFHNRRTAGFALGVLLALSFFAPLGARQAAGAGPCRITGHATSGTTPLPGVSIAVKTGETPHVTTSTEVDGGFAINLPPGQYTLSAELTGFARVDRPLVISADGACNQTVNLSLALMPRGPLASMSSGPGRPRAAT